MFRRWVQGKNEKTACAVLGDRKMEQKKGGRIFEQESENRRGRRRVTGCDVLNRSRVSRVRVREDKNKNTFLRTLSRALHLLPLLLLIFRFPVTSLFLPSYLCAAWAGGAVPGSRSFARPCGPDGRIPLGWKKRQFFCLRGDRRRRNARCGLFFHP